MRQVEKSELLLVYDRLLSLFGHQHWWPSEGAIETMVGAILAQNVSWTGASKAVTALNEHGLLSPVILASAPEEEIAPLIRSSRFYHQKAARIRVFMTLFLSRWNGSVELMAAEEMQTLREALLSLKGFGPETVDSILLYALYKPVFVVDAYTRRIGSRLGWFGETASYQEMQRFFMSRLDPDIPVFNDFHAQIVKLGSTICRSRPDCASCPLNWNSSAGNCRYPEMCKPGRGG